MKKNKPIKYEEKFLNPRKITSKGASALMKKPKSKTKVGLYGMI